MTLKYSPVGLYRINTNIWRIDVLNNEVFIERAKAIHGDKYDYSKVQYTGVRNKVIIICPDHGEC